MSDVETILTDYARAVRRDRKANQADGEGSGLELLLAPRFKTMLEQTLEAETAQPPVVLPEYRKAGLGRPDLALAASGQRARAFVELKAPSKRIQPSALRGHDKDQFVRFSELPVWALTNGADIAFYHRGSVQTETQIVPPVALEPTTSEAVAQRAITAHDTSSFVSIVKDLAAADAPPASDPTEIARTLGHAGRLIREVLIGLVNAGLPDELKTIRKVFDEQLFARPDAAGYAAKDKAEENRRFASAFAQTLIFGLLIARELATEPDADGIATKPDATVGDDAHKSIDADTYPLLRGTLRLLMLEEVSEAFGRAFDVAIDAVNSVDTSALQPEEGKRDPVLYLYEDFLRVFDQKAVAKYGVYYTPPEVVSLIVSETQRALRDDLGRDGFLDEGVHLLDPACGTGTFVISAIAAAAEEAAEHGDAVQVGRSVASFAQRMHAFELLVGPYTVAHYRTLREVRNRQGAASHLPIYLTDTLRPPNPKRDDEAREAGATLMTKAMQQEREAADEVKRDTPILAILGNPPYKRLKRGEVDRLVGPFMARMWEDLKKPVQDAGHGRSLNAFPDLCIAFYRWAIWRLFDVADAPGEGVVAYITNRNFLVSTAYGGLRAMLRDKFDTLRIYDLQGNNRGALPATIENDENVFKIETGVCVLVAIADGSAGGAPARVEYRNAWWDGAQTRKEKLDWCVRAARNPDDVTTGTVDRPGMAPLRPVPFGERSWPRLNELFSFTSNGVVTYRDGFSYRSTPQGLKSHLERWYALPDEQAAEEFKDTRANKSGPAIATKLREEAITEIMYRPFDRRYLYNRKEFVDFPKKDLQRYFAHPNVALMAMSDGTGAGPAVWAHSQLSDQHAFSNRGGWLFPLRDDAPGAAGYNLAPGLLGAAGDALGEPVDAETLFDATLALLSATSYTRRFAHDLEDDFPHVPIPASADLLRRAAAVGARIRAVQAFGGTVPKVPGLRVAGGKSGAAEVTNVPTPKNAWTEDGGTGSVALSDETDLRLEGVPRRVWTFSVSGYSVLYGWLKGRRGEVATDGLLRTVRDVAARLDALCSLYDEADALLEEALAATLTRDDLKLAEREAPEPEDDEDGDDPPS